MFGPLLAQFLGATLLMSAADRLPPRMALAGLALVFGVGMPAQAIPGPPMAARFAILIVIGVFASVGGGVRYRAAERDPPRGTASCSAGR